VMRSRYRRWRALRAQAAAHHHGHSHGHGHSHAPDGPITMKGLLGLGVSGGIVPCPSALVVLIAAISQHKVGLGMGLIGAFSLGLAATLTAVGLAVLYGGRLVERLRPERRIFGGRLIGVLPAVSASVIVLAGTLITLRAIPQVG
jgi:nickel/cobalt exporter